MKDFLKQELSVGDRIIACVTHGRNAGATLVKGVVVGFTEKFVKAELPSYNDSVTELRKICPSKVVKQ